MLCAPPASSGLRRPCAAMRALAADGATLVFVSNQDDATVSVIDTATDTVVATIPVAFAPACIAADRATARRSTSRTPTGESLGHRCRSATRGARAGHRRHAVRHRRRPGRHSVCRRLEQQHGLGHRSRSPAGACARSPWAELAGGRRRKSRAALVFVANRESDTVSILNATTLSLVATLPVGHGALRPRRLARRHAHLRRQRASADMSVLSTQTLQPDRDRQGRADALRRGDEHSMARACSSPTRAPARWRWSTAATCRSWPRRRSAVSPKGWSSSRRGARPTSPTGSRATCRCSTPRTATE